MMYCPKCGYRNGDTAVFCPRCGKSLTVKPEKNPKKNIWQRIAQLDLFLLSIVLFVLFRIWAQYVEYLALETLLSLSSYIPAIITVIYTSIKTTQSGILRRRYLFMQCVEREGEIADKLTKRREALVDAYSQSMIISRLLTDTLFKELSDKDRQRLLSSKAAMAFLRSTGIRTDAKRLVITVSGTTDMPSRQTCPRCGCDRDKEDVYCLLCGNCFKSKSDSNMIDSFIDVVKHFCWE